MEENVHCREGDMWLERNRPEKAVDAYKKALAEEPDNGEAHARLALCLLAVEKLDESKEEAEAAIGLDPDDPMGHFALSLVLRALGRPKEAERAAGEVVRLWPESELGYGALAGALADRKKWEAALEAAEKGLDIDPGDEDCLKTRAFVLIQSGGGDRADFTLEAALRRNPEDSAAHALMGWSHLHKGRTADAVSEYTEALRLDPESDSAREGLVTAMKSRNPLYRLMLKWFLFQTRIKGRYIFAIMIGTIIARSFLRRMASQTPSLALLFNGLFWAMVGFILLTWVAEPIFNLLLRLDRVGRNALSPRDVRQTNWLLGSLAVIALFGGLWAWGVAAMDTAFLFSAMMLIPLMTIFNATKKRSLLILAGYTFLLFLLGTATVVVKHAGDAYLDKLRPFGVLVEEEDRFYLDKEKIEALSFEEVDAITPLLEEWNEKVDIIQAADRMLLYFVIGWVAFTWISNVVLIRG